MNVKPILLLIYAWISNIILFSKETEISSPHISHPRIILDSSSIEKIKNDITNNESILNIHTKIIKVAEQLITIPLLEKKVTGFRMSGTSGTAVERILYLSYAFKSTENIRFANRAIQEMMNICSFTDWNPSHFLDTAEILLALSIGYDWLYDCLDDKEKETIAQAIKEKGLKPSFDNRYNHFFKRPNNWNSVCNAGLVLGASIIMDSDPEFTSEIISRSIKSNKLAMETFEPDGGYPEGYGYWNYGVFYQILLIDVLERVFGFDFGLSSQSGFYKTAKWMQFMASPIEKCFNFSDSTDKTMFNIPAWWFAEKCADTSLIYNENRSLNNGDQTIFATKFLPLLPIFASRLGHREIKPPKENIWYSRGLTPVFIYRRGWDEKTDSYLAIKGGSASTPHAHMDAGSFVFDYDGIRWAMDLGLQSYTSLENQNINLWDKRQEGQRWEILRMRNDYHNTLTIDNERHNVNGMANIIQIFDKINRKGAVVDLTSTLGKVTFAHREVSLDSLDNLHVIDSISTNKDGVNLKWVMVTPAEAQITDNNDIILTKDGKKMRLSFDSDLDVISHIWENTPIHEYDSQNPGTVRVGYSAILPPNSSHRIECTLRPHRQQSW